MLAIPLVVEGRLPATGALIQSWNALKSQWLVAALFHCVLILARLSGLLLCGVGILLTGPALLPGDLDSLPRLLSVSAAGCLEETPRAHFPNSELAADALTLSHRRLRLGFAVGACYNNV